MELQNPAWRGLTNSSRLQAPATLTSVAPDCGEAGRTRGARLLASAGRKASRLQRNTHIKSTHTHTHTLSMCGRSRSSCARRFREGRLQLVTLFVSGVRKPQRAESRTLFTGKSRLVPAYPCAEPRVALRPCQDWQNVMSEQHKLGMGFSAGFLNYDMIFNRASDPMKASKASTLKRNGPSSRGQGPLLNPSCQ